MQLPCIAVVCLACALNAGTLLSSHAAPARKAGQSTLADTPKKKAGMPKFIPSASQETNKERERRLLRECKGRPNAGACSGFSS